MPFLKAAGNVDLFYKDWGSGPPVVLIHGWPLNADMWEYQAVTLAEAGFRVIAYDRRGFGRSEQPWSGYEYNTLADDLRAVIEHLALENVGLVGYSMGGGEIARYMSRCGGAHVAKVALVSSVTPYMVKTADNPEGVDRSTFDEMIEGLKQDRPRFIANFSKGLFGVHLLSSPVSGELMTWAGHMAMMASPKATTECVTAFGETDFRPDMAHFRMPTLIIHGEADTTVPPSKSAQRTAEMIPGATLKLYEHAPHALPFSHATELAYDLIDFLR